MSDNNSRKNLSSKEIANLAIGFIILALIIGVIAIPVNWLQGLIAPWMIEHLPWLFMIAAGILGLMQLVVWIATIALAAVLPVSLMLLISRRTRRFGASGLQYTASVLPVNVWIWSIVFTVNLAGILWLIIGLLFAGIGVIPIAFVAALIKTEWLTALAILVGCIVGIALQVFSTSLKEKSAKRGS